MNQVADFPVVKDIANEPRVSKQSNRKAKTHTIALVPSGYLNTLWPDVRDELARAVDRSNGRWSLEMLFASILNEKQHLWVAFDKDKNRTALTDPMLCMKRG
jgi:hypothetical protein